MTNVVMFSYSLCRQHRQQHLQPMDDNDAYDYCDLHCYYYYYYYCYHHRHHHHHHHDYYYYYY